MEGIDEQLAELTQDIEDEETTKVNPFDGISQMDIDCFNFHNEVRKNPKCFIPELEKMVTKFNGNEIL